MILGFLVVEALQIEVRAALYREHVRVPEERLCEDALP